MMKTLLCLTLLGGMLASTARSAETRNGVLVELFTSQGCSSCPPAEKLFGQLEGAVPNAIPLVWHVDYWNNLGWADPFSKKEWTQRQYAYGEKLNQPSVYTPEAVIGGALGMVGSNKTAILTALSEAASPAAKIEIEAARVDAEIILKIRITPTGKASGARKVCVAIAESGLVTDVPRGENAGARLTGEHVVRAFSDAAGVTLAKDQTAVSTQEVRFPLAKEWRPADLSAVVFLEDSAMRVDAAASRKIE